MTAYHNLVCTNGLHVLHQGENRCKTMPLKSCTLGETSKFDSVGPDRWKLGASIWPWNSSTEQTVGWLERNAFDESPDVSKLHQDNARLFLRYLGYCEPRISSNRSNSILHWSFRLCHRVSSVRPELAKNGRVLHHGNAPAHTSLKVH